MSVMKPLPVELRVPAKQEFRKQCDILHIMDRALKTGELPDMSHQPVFADVSEVGDLGDAMRRVDAARDAFAGLPAAARARFKNDPDEMIQFLWDSKNREEAEKLGLIQARKEPDSVAPPAPVVPVPNAPAVS